MTKYGFATDRADRHVLNDVLKQYIDNETRDLIDGPTVYESNTPIDVIVNTIGECTKLWLYSKLTMSKQQVTLQIPESIHACVQSILLREAQKKYSLLLDRNRTISADEAELVLNRMMMCERLHERLKHSKVIN